MSKEASNAVSARGVHELKDVGLVDLGDWLVGPLFRQSALDHVGLGLARIGIAWPAQAKDAGIFKPAPRPGVPARAVVTDEFDRATTERQRDLLRRFGAAANLPRPMLGGHVGAGHAAAVDIGGQCSRRGEAERLANLRRFL